MMKKFCILTVFICVAFAAASPLAVSADEAGGYPDIIIEPLTFENLSDYAVGDGDFLFAEGQKLIKWNKNDELTFDYEIGEPASDVDYADGKFYYRTASGTYELPESNKNLPGANAVHDFGKSINRDFPKDEGYTYYFDGQNNDFDDGTNAFHVVIQSTNENKTFEGYRKIKPYGGVIYAVKDNCLYTVSAGQAIKKDFRYSNYHLLTQIPAGNAVDSLKLFSERPLKINITPGHSVTRLADPDKITDGERFNTGNTDSARDNTGTEISGIALLLAETGGTYVAAIGKEAYILNKDSAVNGGEIVSSPVENANATPNCEDYAYSLPFVSGSTANFKITPQDKLKVTALITKAENTYLAHDFYLIEKETEGGAVRGYVPKEFLNELNYDFHEGGAALTPDPSPENGDNIRTVVLVLLVVLLALIAAGYLVWLLTTGRKTLKNKSKNANGAASQPGDETPPFEEK